GDAEQRALARAVRPDHAHCFTSFDLQIYVAQSPERFRAAPEALGQALRQKLPLVVQEVALTDVLKLDCKHCALTGNRRTCCSCGGKAGTRRSARRWNPGPVSPVLWHGGVPLHRESVGRNGPPPLSGSRGKEDGTGATPNRSDRRWAPSRRARGSPIPPRSGYRGSRHRVRRTPAPCRRRKRSPVPV